MSLRSSLVASALAMSSAFASCAIADASQTFAVSKVAASLPHGARGHDAGIDVSHGRYVRLTAGGTVVFSAYRACGSVGPRGCPAAFSFDRVTQTAATGALVAAFTDARGALVTSWAPVGEAAYIAIPANASRMLLRVNGATGREYGAYRVVADVVSQPNAGSSMGVRRLFSTARQVANGTSATRAQMQYALRRLAFSASPEDVTAAASLGLGAWVAAQLNPSSIDDSALGTYMEPVPQLTGNSTTDAGYDRTLERRLVQRQVATKRQLLEKVTMHWLEHFAVSEDKVFSPGGMALYEDTVRADALGNFKTLIVDVSEQPAMLRWLDNNYNSGANPAQSPPNENFGRELMQLYTIGINELNQDGSPVVDSSGQPVPAYSETDVKQAALALTGFQTYVPYPLPTGDPRTFEQESFNPQAHAKGPYTIIGRQIADTGDKTIVNNVADVLIRNPSCAPFQVKELLQRFVTEDPSPGYISRMSAVWTKYVDDPNQIAKVIAAIVADPEFANGQDTMVKEPAEFTIDALRELEGGAANPVTTSVPHPLDTIYSDELNLGQGLWYPPSVFGFYRPGEKENLLTNSELLTLWAVDANIEPGANVTAACTNCAANLNLTPLASENANQITSFLLDAMVDGGTPELRALVSNYIGNSTKNVPGAIWIVMSSPEYEVN